MMQRGGNPQQMVISLLQQEIGGTPMGDNLIKLAQEGNGAEIEKIARNLAQQKGLDFDKELASFRKQFGL